MLVFSETFSCRTLMISALLTDVVETSTTKTKSLQIGFCFADRPRAADFLENDPATHASSGITRRCTQPLTAVEFRSLFWYF
jgi:hypothetical protein